MRRLPVLLSCLVLTLAIAAPAASAAPRLTGDTVDDPLWFTGIPAELSGNTCGFAQDYPEMCPYGSMAPDVVYAYEALESMVLDFSLCLSAYDTKIIIYENAVTSGNPLACNDDWCSGPSGTYRSHLEDVPFQAGNTYYIVVTGYGQECGDYLLQIEPTGPCGLDWPNGAQAEGEPDCGDDYVDTYNSGCNAPAHAFQVLEPYWNLVQVAGRSGTFLGGGNPKRDSDWYQITPTAGSELEISCTAEFPLQLYFIDGTGGCGDMVELGAATAPACGTAFVAATVPAGIYWIWVGPQDGSSVPCGRTYALTIDGYDSSSTGVAEPGEPAAAALTLSSLPNPARHGATLHYALAEPAQVRVAIYDIAGRLRRSLVESSPQGRGPQACVWDGRDDAGAALGAGVYLARLEAGERVVTAKLVLLR